MTYGSNDLDPRTATLAETLLVRQQRSLRTRDTRSATRHFQAKLDQESDRLWDEGILDQQRLDELRKEDLHRKFSKVEVIKLDEMMRNI